MHSLYVYELAKIQQTEMEERAWHARLVGSAVRARRAFRRASAQASAERLQSNRIPANRTSTDRADLSSAMSSRR